jgi:uncharacterized protein (DUF983 family)
MSGLLITVTDDGAIIEDLLPLPKRANARPRSPKPSCPKCGSDNLRHRVLSRWHECKQCRHSFAADCSRHKHGGSL